MSDETNKKPRRRKLTVYLFNVGQGENILIRLPNGHYGIIDFYYDPKLDLIEPPALTYLKKIRRRLKQENPIVISFICISHPHYDHLKGASTLLSWIEDENNNIDLRGLWLFAGSILEEFIGRYKEYAAENIESNGTKKASAASQQLSALFAFRDRWPGYPEYLQDIRKVPGDFGGDMKVVAIAPLGKHVHEFNRDAQRQFIEYVLSEERIPGAEANLLSSVLMMIYGQHRLFFGGDTGSRIWEECIQHYDDGNFSTEFGELIGNFVKASHHGSQYSSAEGIWTRILEPEGRVGISAGIRVNGHPDVETLVQINGVLNTVAENRSIPKIVATNSCIQCVTNHELPRKTFEWLLSKRPHLHDDVEEQFEKDRPDGDMATQVRELKQAQTVRPMVLTTYVFQFDPGSEIQIYKGVSYRARKQKDCQYRTELSDPFPHCALQAVAGN